MIDGVFKVVESAIMSNDFSLMPKLEQWLDTKANGRTLWVCYLMEVLKLTKADSAYVATATTLQATPKQKAEAALAACRKIREKGNE